LQCTWRGISTFSSSSSSSSSLFVESKALCNRLVPGGYLRERERDSLYSVVDIILCFMMFMLLLLFNRSRASMYAGDVEGGKSCCGVTVTQTVSIRWFIVMIAFVGICCAVVGTVLGAMRSSGREHLTVSLLMIGNIFLLAHVPPSSFFVLSFKRTIIKHSNNRKSLLFSLFFFSVFPTQ